MRKVLSLVVLSCLSIIFIGCPRKPEPETGGGGQPGEPQVLTSIEIKPASAVIPKGKSQKFTAIAKDQHGREMTGITFTWASSNPGNVSITADGWATALKDYYDITPNAEPTSTITASAGGITSNAATVTCVINIEGSWRHTMNGSVLGTFTAKQTGRSFIWENWTGFQTGTISGNSITWTERGAVDTFTFTGTIATNRASMSGTYSSSPSGYTGTWSATKQ